MSQGLQEQDETLIEVSAGREDGDDREGVAIDEFCRGWSSVDEEQLLSRRQPRRQRRLPQAAIWREVGNKSSSFPNQSCP
jgi:hypothetical protein